MRILHGSTDAHTLARLGLLLTLVAAVLLGGPTNHAAAHAALIAAEPADGSVIASGPQSFALTFSEPVSPIILRLVNPDGSRDVLDRYQLRDTRLEIVAPPALANGTHVLSWRVISEDGHPVGGSLVFSIGAPSVGGAAASEAPDRWLEAATWLARVLLYGGLFIGAGGSFFMRLVGGEGRGPRRVARGALIAGLVAAPLSIGLLGLDALDLPLTHIADGSVWSTAWTTSYAVTVAIGGIALLAALAALSIRGPIGKSLAVIALIGVGLALAASGHASTAPPLGLTRPAVFLHAVGIAFWTGALVPLGVALSARDTSGAALLRRFSRIIPLAILPLIAAGLLLAIVQLQSIEALWTTAYGRVFLVKLALLVALFALAAVNRFHFTAPAERGDRAAINGLRRSIIAELALVLAIFGTAAFWRFTPPPRALAEAARQPAAIHIHTADAMADVAISPGHAGSVSISISLMTGDFGPLDAKAVRLTLANPGAGIEAIRRQAIMGADARWHVERLDLPVGGHWVLKLAILINDFKQVTLEDTIDIRP